MSAKNSKDLGVRRWCDLCTSREEPEAGLITVSIESERETTSMDSHLLKGR